MLIFSKIFETAVLLSRHATLTSGTVILGTEEKLTIADRRVPVNDPRGLREN